jgi:hypothetical protein
MCRCFRSLRREAEVRDYPILLVGNEELAREGGEICHNCVQSGTVADAMHLVTGVLVGRDEMPANLG